MAERLTRPGVDVDQTAARYMGGEVKIQDLGDGCTNWHPNEEAAVIQWNALIAAAAAKRNKNNA